MRQIIKPRYLGDGVYAHYNGFTTGHHDPHRAQNVIALEDTVYDEVVRFGKEALLARRIIIHLRTHDAVSTANELGVDIELVREIEERLK